MFNSPLLDVAIGLVFIFLLYSLLATAIHEAVASLFGLRARMLRDAITIGMLSNTSTDSRLISFWKGVQGFFFKIVRISPDKPYKGKIGEKFYDYPLIKNYGSSRFFPIPSYIPSSNFSTVLINILTKEFDAKKEEIKKFRMEQSGGEGQLIDWNNVSNVFKIKELLDYYAHYYAQENVGPPSAILDRDTWQIIQMHLHNSLFDLDQFTSKMEKWYDDSMNRVSGWYKRQTQFILIVLGFTLAIIFNVDTIKISQNLSTDKDARDKLVQMATEAVEKYKDDPRVMQIVVAEGVMVPDTSAKGKAANLALYEQYQQKADSIQAFISNDLQKANDLLSLGWGNYGGKKSYFGRVGHVLKATFTSFRKFIGFLILAFAVSLGAPFWFDLLNKLVKLRSSGKKEESQTTIPVDKVGTAVNVQISNSSSGEEAVG
ncbi:MAG: hypothetical protein ACOYN5_05300 [Bacteroidales bacterium]